MIMKLKATIYIHTIYYLAFLQASEEYDALIIDSEIQLLENEDYHLVTIVCKRTEELFCIGKRYQELSNSISLIDKSIK